MASEVAADEPPAIDTVRELCAADEPPAIDTIRELCAAYEPRAFGPVRQLYAADEPRGIGTVPEICATDAPPEAQFVSKDTNYHNPLESNNNIHQHNSDNDSMNENREQTFQGDCSEVEQSKVDLIETDASDGMLFDGFRTMLQKSIERKLTRKVLKKQSNKRARPQGGKTKECPNKERATAYSRFSIGYFVKIVECVCKSNYRMELVRNSGFGFLLELDDCYVPRAFAQWVADNISTKHEAIVLKGKSIPLNPEAVSLVLGIPVGSTPTSMVEEETGKVEFLALFGLTELPSISFFVNKLMTEELSDDDFVRYFLTVALATFLCPTSNTKPSTKYLGALVDVSKLKDLN